MGHDFMIYLETGYIYRDLYSCSRCTKFCSDNCKVLMISLKRTYIRNDLLISRMNLCYLNLLQDIIIFFIDIMK